MKAENIDIEIRPVSDPGGRILYLDTCHDCGRVLHSGIFCSGCLAWSDHRPTPAVSPAVPGAAAGSMTGDSGAVRAVRGSTAPRSDYEKGGK